MSEIIKHKIFPTILIGASIFQCLEVYAETDSNNFQISPIVTTKEEVKEDEVIKGIIEQLTLEGIKGEISAINGFDVKNSTLVTKNDFVIRKTKAF